ncbi:hypothetical protein ABIB26_003880 [Arthrobacter sp. UYEF20]
MQNSSRQRGSTVYRAIKRGELPLTTANERLKGFGRALAEYAI